MRKIGLLFFAMIIGIVLVIGLLWSGSARYAQAEPARQELTPTQTAVIPWTEGDEGSGSRISGFGDEDSPPAEIIEPMAVSTPKPGETLVFFSTTDNDATATVLYLTNTDTVSHSVELRGYNYAGTLGYLLNIVVPASGFVRLSSDSIAASPPPSWSTPAPIITNFTDFTYFASLSLPKGVKVEGYFLYNPGTGTVDPRADQGAVPLRFSTDPSSVYLPSVSSGR